MATFLSYKNAFLSDRASHQSAPNTQELVLQAEAFTFLHHIVFTTVTFRFIFHMAEGLRQSEP